MSNRFLATGLIGAMIVAGRVSAAEPSPCVRGMDDLVRMSRCELDAAPMRDAAEWVERYRRFWETQLDQLKRYVEQDKPGREKESGS